MEIPYTVEARPDTGLYNAKVGIWLFLASEVMLFGALFSTYILLRVGAAEGFWPHGWLNIPIGTVDSQHDVPDRAPDELIAHVHKFAGTS